MQYKTIMFELIQQHPLFHGQLRRKRMLLAVLNSCATLMRDRHQALMEHLSANQTVIDRSQITSAAMEMAVKEMELRLQAGLLASDLDSMTGEDLIALVRELMSRA